MISIADLTALTPHEKELFLKHCVLAGRMRRLCNLRKFLINEIHTKRGSFRRNPNKYKINPELTILCGGKKRVSSLHIFPYSYQNALECLMFFDFNQTNIERVLIDAGHSDIAKLIGIYYKPDIAVKEIQDETKFDEREWSFNDQESDFAILERYRDEIISYMLRAEELIAQATPTFSLSTLKKERKRYAKVCGLA